MNGVEYHDHEFQERWTQLRQHVNDGESHLRTRDSDALSVPIWREYCPGVNRFYVIINGIDQAKWNPQTDPPSQLHLQALHNKVKTNWVAGRIGLT